MRLEIKSDDALLRRVKRLADLAIRLIGEQPALAIMAMERSDAARAELLRRYPRWGRRHDR